MLIFSSKSLSFAKKYPQKKKKKRRSRSSRPAFCWGAVYQRCGDAALSEMESWIFRKLVVFVTEGHGLGEQDPLGNWEGLIPLSQN